MSEKSDRLKREVWDQDRCTGCGMCVTACSKGVLSFNETQEHPVRESIEKVVGLSHTKLDACFFCEGACAECCPRLEEWGLGETTRIASVRTTRTTKSGARSDVIADLLCSLLKNGFIDGAILMDVDRWTLRPVSKIATSVGELAVGVGNQYIWGPQLLPLRDAVRGLGLKRLALVGSPCSVQAIRRVQGSSLEELRVYKEAIKLLIGVFCSGVLSYEVIPEVIEKDMGIPMHSILRVSRSTKENELKVVLRDGSSRSISLLDIQQYVRKACARCDDFLAEMADLSVGEVGAKSGYCTVIARNSKGLRCLLNGVDLGFLELSDEVDVEALDAARKEKERRKRVQMFDSLSILMLDAFTDSTRVEEAKRRFKEVHEMKGEGLNVKRPESGCEGCGIC